MSMQASTISSHDLATGRTRDRASGPGFFSRFATRFIDAQMRSANVRAAREIRHLSDGHLNALGLNAKQIAELRETGRLSA